MTVAAVVLAAGASRRLGQPKQVLALDGGTVLDATLSVARESGCAPVVVVLGGAAERVRADVDLTAGTVAVRRTIIRVQGKGLIASRVKSKASERGLIMPSWCVEMLRERRVHRGGFEGPVFPDSLGGWRDRSNVGRAFRAARLGSDFEWVKTHTYRKTVATLLDGSGASARMIALPALLIPSSCSVSPLPCVVGVRPAAPATCRRLRKARQPKNSVV